MSDSEQLLFRHLAGIFQTHRSCVLEIEILPPEFGPLLQDGCAIGITKKALVQAFVVARRVFFDKLVFWTDRELLTSCLSITEKSDTAERSNFSGVTEIMLLFDCEHLTACNWRKRRLDVLIQSLRSGNGIALGSTVAQVLESELTLLTSFLCSPLHRHTKSPTLWQHRLWVMTQIFHIRAIALVDGFSISSPSTTPDGEGLWGSKNTEELIHSELSVALRASEQHPRNVYAFSYMRHLHRALSDTAEDITTPSSAERLARCIIYRTVEWCMAHPRDISGWMFALYLLQATPDKDFRSSVLHRVVSFAVQVGWDGESLWIFVDQTARAFGLVNDLYITLPSLHGETSDLTGADQTWRLWLARARALWADCENTST
ncbi:hypothetical protein ASPZODRAFT_134933 [Penicilliopsis zonata CBS 506.65]|uniref:Uncharacterized protein n=1 Tax=Penicilliopsis zonata CBS 506.65 TaxID=1073090 RepID=A0A1L9SC96_9EURO|nr:hypothetical protein ASPZODRAFT_134933 [Penicilliopsis zonata CBS 506.65]OJJ44796.1 hypothetical protein ASPZODRAFT_134933 [Penicilliopsis zonata CBS 506.65]